MYHYHRSAPFKYPVLCLPLSSNFDITLVLVLSRRYVEEFTAGTGKKDILILILGATGAGKSFFINKLLGQEKMKVGRGLNSCTSEPGLGYIQTIERYPALKDYQILLVDTPGFDDSVHEDTQILKKIADWLKNFYKGGAKLGGVIYLHDISSSRFNGGARQNLQNFQKLCGDVVLHNAALVTTKWDLHVPDAQRCHDQLVAGQWKHLIKKGAKVHKFDSSYDSAWRIIEQIVYTAIQRGPIILQPNPLHTTAGKYTVEAIKTFLPFRSLFGRKTIF
ncbi:P-loop containing nucleoside triphosphate hydrolase protein [Gymnopilus junonius]|uniref:P-loop containing nucleoside triphosphate hydrolase protein n=1 Tax=Gymnopilus junonius TaxID=109634 RepID=A0A9P5NUK3_GYMJU|nr:P-loop containing nucleoside triphosphate hydrolase protein [Gymnopilus junonius]